VGHLDRGLIVDTVEREWLAWTLPITTRFGHEVAAEDLAGSTVACHQHLIADTIAMIEPLLAAGVRVRMAACNPDSTDDEAAAHLASQGVEIRARSGMSAAEHADALAWLAGGPADALCDMGGELIAAVAARGGRPAGALEATTTGLHRLRESSLPFPVLNWNGITLKDRIHNRHHVGLEAWSSFTAITGLALYGRSVLVVGFGTVGRGVALHARDLGAIVAVADLDPVRLLEARHHGCRPVTLDDGLPDAEIVVTATGFDRVVDDNRMSRLADGAILVNVGHSNREFDVDWLDRHPRTRVRRHLDRYEVDGRHLFLLNRGSPVNLAAGVGATVPQLFDPFSAVMLLGLRFLLTGGASGLPHGVQPYPAPLEARIAEALTAG
jgi:adenosylhomocysteinase